MTYVSNQSANVASYEAVCDSTGAIVSNSSLNAELPLQQHNFMVTAKGPAGPWSAPVAIDKPLDDAVAPFPGFTKAARPNRNTNLVIAIQPDGSMVGLWRRCCKESTDPKLQPAGGGGVSSTPPSENNVPSLVLDLELPLSIVATSRKHRCPQASIIFSVHATNWKDVSTWKASSRQLFPELKANGYEDPHIWRDPTWDPIHKNVFHAVL